MAGQVNLRGRLTKTLRCGCCEVRNLRGPYFDLLARREIRQATVRCGDGIADPGLEASEADHNAQTE
jgi:hypothetical protein